MINDFQSVIIAGVEKKRKIQELEMRSDIY